MKVAQILKQEVSTVRVGPVDAWHWYSTTVEVIADQEIGVIFINRIGFLPRRYQSNGAGDTLTDSKETPFRAITPEGKKFQAISNKSCSLAYSSEDIGMSSIQRHCGLHPIGP
jgi:hypothetical protein